MKAAAQNGYSEEEVLAQLLNWQGTRIDTDRFELFTPQGLFIRDVTNIVAGSFETEEHALDNPKSRCSFTAQDDPLPLASYPDTILRDNPTFYFRMNETSGTVMNDSSINNHDGAYVGAVQLGANSLLVLEDGESDTAVRFPGTVGVLASVPYNSSFDSNDFTFEFSIQTTSTSTGFAIRQDDFGSNRRLDIQITGAGRIQITLFFTGATSAVYVGDIAPLNDGARHTVIITYDRQFVRAWADFALVMNKAETRTLRTANTPLLIGDQIAGVLDEISRFPYALSVGQVREHHQAAIRDYNQIKYGLDQIKAWYGFYMPDGGHVEWAMGVFDLITPDRAQTDQGVRFEVKGFDRASKLDIEFEDVETVTAGTNYSAKVKEWLERYGILQHNITATANTLPADLEFTGTALEAINTLLKNNNFDELWFDEHGTAIVQPHVMLKDKPVGFTYYVRPGTRILTELSMAVPKRIYKDDFYRTPNRIICYTGSIDGTNLRSVSDNTSLSSRASIPNRGGQIITYKEQVSAPDQPTLDAYAERRKEELSQICVKSDWPTYINPLHQHLDKVRIFDEVMNEKGKFIDFIEEDRVTRFAAGGVQDHSLSACEVIE